jgi:hypothetical protein
MWVLALCVVSLAQSMIYMGAVADSAVLMKNGKPVAVLSWRANAVQGINDNLIALIGDNYEAPPSDAGENVPLNFPVIIYPVSIDTIRFGYGSVYLSFIADSVRYTFDDFTPPPTDASSTEYNPVCIYTRLGRTNKYQVNRASLANGRARRELMVLSGQSTFIPVAHNILSGQIPAGTHFGCSDSPLYVPMSDTCNLLPGIVVDSALIAYGRLIISGTPDNSVHINVINLRRSGMGASGTPNHTITGANVNVLNIAGCKADVKKSNIGMVSCTGPDAVLDGNGASFSRVSISNARGMFSSCSLGVGGYVGCSGSILSIRNSHLENGNKGPCEWRSSFIYLAGNTIRGAGETNASCGNTQNALIIAVDNIFEAPCSTQCGVGLMIEGQSYGLVKHNIFRYFIAGVETDGGATAVVCNNTFYNVKEHGYRNSGGNVSAAIINNIFYNDINSREITPISFENSMVNTGSHFWLYNNIWYHPRQSVSNWVRPFIDYRGDATIYGDTIGINVDPLFADTVNCTLSANSMAIDAGLSVIKGFARTFTVLDTTITLAETLAADNYGGNAPDIGAREYGYLKVIQGHSATSAEMSPNPVLFVSNQGEDLHIVLTGIAFRDNRKMPIAKLCTIDGRIVEKANMLPLFDKAAFSAIMHMPCVAQGMYLITIPVEDHTLICKVPKTW